MAYEGMDNAMTNEANKQTGVLRRFGLTGAIVAAACLAAGATFLGYGVDANLPWPVTSNTTIAAKYCQGTVLAGTGSTGQFTLTLPAVTGFPTNCSVLIKNGDTSFNKTLSGFPADVGTTLFPSLSFGVKIVNGAWASFYYTPTRIQAPSASFYVNGSPLAQAACGSTGGSICAAGSDSNNCLTPSTACLTLQRVVNLALSSYDFAGAGNNVYLAHNIASTIATNYAATCGGPIIGAVSIAVRGDNNAPTAVQIQAPNGGNAVTLTNLCLMTFTSVEFIDSPSSNAASYISVGGGHNPVHSDLLNVTFAACAVCSFVSASYSGTVAIVGGLSMTGGAALAFQATGGVIDFGFTSVTVANNLTFSAAFAQMTNGGSITGTTTSTFGTPTGIIGTKCIIVGQPILLGSLEDPNQVFPGNSNCIINTLVGALAVQTSGGGYSFGNAGQFLVSGGGGTGGAPNGVDVFRNIQGSDLPNPSASTLGGIESIAALAHNWIASIDTSGVPHQSQPATSDLSDVTAPTSWTATDASGASLSFSTSDTLYTKIGKACTVSFAITYPTTANSSNAQIGGIPAACAARNGTLNYVASGAIFGYSTAANAALQTNGQSLFILSQGGGILTNANLSGLTIRGTITYITN
jgi:hypothetical protein